MAFLSFFTCCTLCFQPTNHSGFICNDCWQQLLLSEQPEPNSKYIDQQFCGYRYSAPLSHWLIALKDNRQLNHLPKILWCMKSQPANFHSVDFITYIPSDTKKLMLRGFNPAELIAKAIAKEWNIKAHGQLLIKTAAKDQRGLTQKQRRQNIQHSLKAGRQDLSGLHILLIEDVITTGATVDTAARLLKQQGAKKVSVWALAHTLLEPN